MPPLRQHPSRRHKRGSSSTSSRTSVYASTLSSRSGRPRAARFSADDRPSGPSHDEDSTHFAGVFGALPGLGRRGRGDPRQKNGASDRFVSMLTIRRRSAAPPVRPKKRGARSCRRSLLRSHAHKQRAKGGSRQTPSHRAMHCGNTQNAPCGARRHALRKRRFPSTTASSAHARPARARPWVWQESERHPAGNRTPHDRAHEA